MIKEILNSILNKRADLIKVIFVAILLAFGIGLLVNYFTLLFETKSNIILYGGIFFILLVFIYLTISILLGCKRRMKVSGLIVFKNENIIPIDRYIFSERLSETLQAVFIENKALKQSWSEDFNKKENREKNKSTDTENKELNPEEKPLSYYSIIKLEVPENEIKKDTKSKKILKEAVEYIFIEKLSTHLSTHFNDYTDEDKILKEFTRSDFPNILLQNRLINLLSSPFEDRPIFLKAKMTKHKEKGKIVAIGGSDGSRFTRFDLVLPKKSEVIRKENGVLQIKSPRMILEFNINYGDFAATLPRGFEYNYLGISSSKISVKEIDLNLEITIKPLALLFSKGWNYYNWIDSFISKFSDVFSFDAFIKKIEWESTLTRIIVTNQRQKFAYEHSKKKKENKSKVQANTQK